MGFFARFASTRFSGSAPGTTSLGVLAILLLAGLLVLPVAGASRGLSDTAGASELADFRASSLTTLIPMVASGAGVTLLPTLATGVSAAIDRDLSLVPFTKPSPSRTIGVAWRRTSPRGEEFSELARLFLPRSERRKPRP